MAASASSRRSGTMSMSMGADIDDCDTTGIAGGVVLSMTVSLSWAAAAPIMGMGMILSASRGKAGCSGALEPDGSPDTTTWHRVHFAEALFWASHGRSDYG